MNNSNDGNKKKVMGWLLLLIGLIVALFTVFTLAACQDVVVVPKITVTYVMQDGTFQNGQLEQGNVQLYTPENEVYNFVGWYCNAELTVPADEAYFSALLFDEPITLYSKWYPKTPVIVNFSANGGSSVPSVAIPKGGSLSTFGFTERDGYTLLGWCYDETLTTFCYVGEAINEDINLYAKWISNDTTELGTATINFLPNNGTAIGSMTVDIGKCAVLPEPFYMGYEFKGWFVDERFMYECTAQTVIVSNMLLYAKWEKSTAEYTLTFVTNGGSQIKDKTYLVGTYVRLDELEKPYKPDDTFVGWCTDYQCTQFSNNDFYVLGNMTFYAKWKNVAVVPGSKFTVTFCERADKTLRRELVADSVDYAYTPEREGWKFEGWYTTEDYDVEYDFTQPLQQDVSIFAKWSVLPEHGDLNFTYELSSDGTYYTVTGFSNYSQDVTIPATFMNLPIKAVADSAFLNLYIRSLVFNENMEIIGNDAFTAASISELILPESLVSVGESAFARCVSLASVTIKGQTALDNMAFKGCVSMSELTAEKVTAIGSQTFYGCSSLKSVTLNGVQTVAVEAFSDCISLESVVIGEQAPLSVLSEKAFYGCTRLREFTASSNLISLGDNAFARTGMINADLKYIKSLGSGVFADCNGLATAYIGRYLTDVPYDTFLACRNLTSYSVDSASTTFSVFAGDLYNKDLTELVFYAIGKTATSFALPSAVKTIRLMPFAYSNNLTEISVGANCSSLNPIAFAYASSLHTINVAEDNANYKSVDGCLYSKDGKTLYKYPEGKAGTVFVVPDGTETLAIQSICNLELDELYLPSTVTTVSSMAISYSSIGKIKANGNVSFAYHALLESSVGEIESRTIAVVGEQAFYQTGELSTVELAYVRSIGGRAFAECKALTSVTVGDSCDSLGDYAFENCSELTSVVFGAGIGLINDTIFSGCDKLTSLTVHSARVINIAGDISKISLYVPSVLLSEYVTKYGSQCVGVFAIQ